MAHFKIEVMDVTGKTIGSYSFDLPCGTVEQAGQFDKLKKIAKEAKAQQLGYRIKREG